MIDHNSIGEGFDPTTLAFYAKEAPIYAASGKAGEFRLLTEFLDRLKPGASILELGCGGGLDAAFMLSRGFHVDPTDGTAEIAALAEKRLARPVRVMRFDELDANQSYDAVVAAASLLHVPRPAFPDVLTRIWCALKPGGWHIASFKGGGTEGRDRYGRYFNYFTADELKGLYHRAGKWAECDIWSGMGGGYDGKEGPWHAVTVQRPG